MWSRIGRAFGATYTGLSNWGARPTNTAYYVPITTFSIIVANFLVYCTGHQWGFRGDDLAAHPWDLLWYQFSHINFQHLAGNTIFMLFAAPPCEKYLGHIKFLLFYLWCGCVSALGFLTIFSDGVIMGASGAIFGCLAIYPLVQRSIVACIISGLVVGSYFLMGFHQFILQVSDISSDLTAHLGHIMGGVAGLAAFGFIKRK